MGSTKFRNVLTINLQFEVLGDYKPVKEYIFISTKYTFKRLLNNCCFVAANDNSSSGFQTANYM